jgi:hypothetical protein
MKLSEPRVAIRLHGAALAALFLAAALTGCSTEDPVPICDRCEKWSKVSSALGRFPAPHPVDPSFVLFSTVEKQDPADARQEDEDIWLTWIENEDDPDANAILGRSLFVITPDDTGTSGDNTSPRWSPSGTRMAYVHSPPAGGTEIWTMTIDLPTERGQSPNLGVPERIVADARDPAWLAEDRLLFSRDDKIFRIDVGGASEVQVSFDPPSYSSTDKYVDRHPSVSPDGEVVFGSRNRLPVADLYVQAFEVDSMGAVETDAFISFKAPEAAEPTFPVFDEGEELRTPALMRSIPTLGIDPFQIGTTLARSVVIDPLRENYCDTTIVIANPLEPDTADTLSFFFEITRGTLGFLTESTNASFFWTRADGAVSINDFPGAGRTDRCIPVYYDCLLPWSVQGDSILVDVPEPFLVTASSAGRDSSYTVFLSPGDTTVVLLFDDPGRPPCSEPQPLTGAPATGRASIAPARWAQSGASVPRGAAGSSAALLRALGDESNIWRLEFDASDATQFGELLGSAGLIQSPAVTKEFAGGVRYSAWVSDETGEWQVYVQRLVNWVAQGEPHLVRPPGTLDNLACTRNVFHPHWDDAGSVPGGLRLFVTMTECPDNEFSDLGFDEDPWAIGEMRVWTVIIDDYQ